MKFTEVALRLHADDNIAVATTSIEANTVLKSEWGELRFQTAVPAGHKFSLREIEKGEPVRKYGQIIGFATSAIELGTHVHTHNLECGSYNRNHQLAIEQPQPAHVLSEQRYFDGYLRPDGRVGTRNYIAVVSTVNCSATVVRAVAERFSAGVLQAYPNIDGVFSVAHKTGCGMAASGLDRTYLQRTLAGFADHPNVFGSVVIGLGCEVHQPSEFIAEADLIGKTRSGPTMLTIQSTGGIQKTIEAGVAAVADLLPGANDVRRSKQPIRHLMLGTNCGGSDGASGITANPALGLVSDLLISQGGTSILAETTEIYGAEHLLTRRARSRAVAEKLLERIHWWEWYTSVLGASIDNNPSHGNKAGGLTTIFEKSLGAVSKAGSSTLEDVVGYAERVKTPGFVFMDTPGFDPVSVTGIVAGGANVVAFTTGRGSVLGSKPAPTIKIATNTPLYERMTDDMDFNAGTILDGEPVESVGRRLFELVLAVASGRKTKSELLGVGDEEFAPWIIGPVL